MILALLIAAAHAGDAPAGQVLYTANCTACHGKAGDGKGPAAIALKPRPPDFTSAAWWTAERTDASLGAVIRAGKAGSGMTGFTQFSDADVDNVVTYLRTLSPAAASPAAK
jgi:mono/diheme cytochrome c family protein